MLRLIFLAVLFIFGVTFSCLNADNVKIDLYVKTFECPLSLVLALTLSLGLLVGFVFSGVKLLKAKRAFAKLQKKLSLAEKEVKNLRDIPIKDAH